MEAKVDPNIIWWEIDADFLCDCEHLDNGQSIEDCTLPGLVICRACGRRFRLRVVIEEEA